MAYGII